MASRRQPKTAVDSDDDRMKPVAVADKTTAAARAECGAKAFTIPPKWLFKSSADEVKAIQDAADGKKMANLSSTYAKTNTVTYDRVAQTGQMYVVDQAARQAAAHDKVCKDSEKAAAGAQHSQRPDVPAASSSPAADRQATDEAPPSSSIVGHAAGDATEGLQPADAAEAPHAAGPAATDGPARNASAAELRAETEMVASRAILVLNVTERGHVMATGSAHFMVDPEKMYDIIRLANEIRISFDRQRYRQWVDTGVALALTSDSIATRAPAGAMTFTSQSSQAALKGLLQGAMRQVYAQSKEQLPRTLGGIIDFLRDEGMRSCQHACHIDLSRDVQNLCGPHLHDAYDACCTAF